MGQGNSSAKDDDVVVVEQDDLLEIVEIHRIDPRAEPVTSDDVPHRVLDSSPPSDETELRDVNALARVLDRNAVPKRLRVEMVTAPLSVAAVDVLRAVDGKATIAEIVTSTKLSEDSATAGLQQLVELRIIAFR